MSKNNANLGMNKAEPSDDEIHVTEQICCNFIAGNNPPCNKLQKVLIEVLEPNNLDKLLFTLTKMIDQNELTDILAFLRSMEVLDCSDCECINNKEMTTKKVIALVDVLNQRGPHKLWYMLHALQPKHKIFFSEKHGNIKCCICDDVERMQIGKVSYQKEPASTQGDVLEELRRKTDSVKASFSMIENSIKSMLLPLENLKNEIHDVMSHPSINDSCGHSCYTHANITILQCVKNKYFKLLERFYKTERNKATQASDIQGVLCEEIPWTNPCLEKKEPQETYLGLFLNFEERFFKEIRHCNPLITVQECICRMKSYAKNNKRTLVCLVGATVCIEIVGSCLIDYGLSAYG